MMSEINEETHAKLQRKIKKLKAKKKHWKNVAKVLIAREDNIFDAEQKILSSHDRLFRALEQHWTQMEKTTNQKGKKK